MTRNAVRRLRARLGLTQTRFAALLGVHKITVAKWEGGTKGDELHVQEAAACPRGARPEGARPAAASRNDSPSEAKTKNRENRE